MPKAKAKSKTKAKKVSTRTHTPARHKNLEQDTVLMIVGGGFLVLVFIVLFLR